MEADNNFRSVSRTEDLMSRFLLAASNLVVARATFCCCFSRSCSLSSAVVCRVFKSFSHSLDASLSVANSWCNFAAVTDRLTTLSDRTETVLSLVGMVDAMADVGSRVVSF